jgi:hypothetical protein
MPNARPGQTFSREKGYRSHIRESKLKLRLQSADSLTQMKIRTPTDDAGLQYRILVPENEKTPLVEALVRPLQLHLIQGCAALLLDPQNRVLGHLRDPKFDYGLGWNPDLLLRLWIKPGTRLPFLLHQLAKTRQNEFAVLFDRFVGEVAKENPYFIYRECLEGETDWKP